MTITHVRTINSIVLLILSASGHVVYGWYLVVMHLSLEVLNRQSRYLTISYKFYNTIFVIYETVLLARIRNFPSTEDIEWLINFTEHLLFSLVICLKFYIYTGVFTPCKRLSRLQRGLITFICFNLLGLFNELFQNELSGRSLLVFVPDSIKDIQVNMLGAMFFVMGVFWKSLWLKKTISGATG